ncbi:hypothetical protein [Chryseobacterium sp. JK1]|uniref:hypothetical protein n=1 Tax=Chryseobacterium sp. JK1 TaxID=874294 RepID=UPI003D68C302
MSNKKRISKKLNSVKEKEYLRQFKLGCWVMVNAINKAIDIKRKIVQQAKDYVEEFEKTGKNAEESYSKYLEYLSLNKKYFELKKQKDPDLKELREIHNRLLEIDKGIPISSVYNSSYGNDSSSRSGGFIPNSGEREKIVDSHGNEKIVDCHEVKANGYFKKVTDSNGEIWQHFTI